MDHLQGEFMSDVASPISVASALATRRSVRAFQDKPVDPALLRDIFRQAQRAPSGGNLQPWQGVIVTGEPWTAVKQAVAGRIAMGKAGQQPEYDIYPPAITDPWESRRYGVGEGLYASLNIPREDRAGRLQQFMENYRGFGAPVMLFVHCSRIMGSPQWSDMGMWLQSLMLLLVEAGLATCPQECWAMYGKTVRDTLGLDDGQILFTGLAIGYADTDAPVNNWPVPRADIDDILEWQGF